MTPLPNRALLLAAQSPLGWTPWWGLRPKLGSRMGWSAILIQSFTGFAVCGALLYALLLVTLGVRDPYAVVAGGMLGGLARGLWFLMVRAAWNSHLDRPMPEPGSGSWSALLVGLVLRLGVLLTAVTLVYGIENVRGSLVLRSLDAELRARGTPMTLDSIVPPPIPDEKNFAMSRLIRPALDIEYPADPLSGSGNSSTNTTTRWRDPEGWKRMQTMLSSESRQPKQSLDAFRVATNAVPGHARPPRNDQGSSGHSYVAGTRLPLATYQAYYRWLPDWPKPSDPGSPGRDVLIGLSASDADVKELMATAHERPLGRFPLEYERGPATLLPHLAALKRMVHHLQLRAVAHLAEGQSAEALDGVQLALRFSDLLSDEPILISHLVRIAMDRVTLQPIWEGCLDRRWNDAQLEALQTSLAQREYFQEYQRVLRGEGALARITYDILARQPRMIEGLSATDSEEPYSGWVTFAACAPRGWIRENLATHLRAVDNYLAQLAGMTTWQAETKMSDAVLALSSKSRLNTVIAGRLLSAVSTRRTTDAEAWRRLALVGLALERHHLAHGRYPESLAALSPAFLATVPDDPMTGQPLVYRRESDGTFHLYSVGHDGRDDGGIRPKSGRAGADDGDFVWR